MAKKLPDKFISDIPVISERYKNGESCATIAKDYGVCTATVWNMLKKEGVDTRSNKKLTKADKKKLIDWYQDGLSTYEIGERLNIDATTVQRWLDKLNIEKRTLSEAIRTYTIDETFFDEIDTEEKAYFLGWLYSDGCNSTYDNMNKNRNNIIIQLQKRDKEVLEKFLACIKSDAPLAFIEPSTKNEQGYYRMSIYNKHMSKMLVKHGVIANKTFDVKYPTWMPEHLKRHFIRGVFDGDGSVYVNYSKSTNKIIGANISIIGTEDMCNKMFEIMYEELCLPAVYVTNTNKTDERIRTLKLSRKIGVYKFSEWLYKDATIWLSRKKCKFDELKQSII